MSDGKCMISIGKETEENIPMTPNGMDCSRS